MRRLILVAAMALALAVPAAVEASQVDRVRGEISILTTAPRAAPGESRVESRVFASRAIGAEMHYFAYLPPGYDQAPNARYPVVYMLHGMGGSNTEWPGYGLFGAADELIKAGEIRPLLIVAPAGDQGFWFDHADGKRYGTYVAQEVVAEIDGRYRTIRSRQARAVGGLSMGANGALQLGINHPRVFSIVGAHGPSLRGFEEMVEFLGPEMAERWLRNDDEYYRRFDPLRLYPSKATIARTLRIAIDVGADDETWRTGGEQFHEQLLRSGIPHSFATYPGDHNGDRYWRPHAQEFLRFYAEAFEA